jgi:acetylornithine deacetylase/succinyl-diaminopimelate desuccinylase-like protein
VKLSHISAIAMSAMLAAQPLSAASTPSKPWHATAADQQSARALLEEIVAIPTAKGRAGVPKLVDVLAARLTEAGFASDDIIRVPVTIDGEETMGLIVRYAGRNPKRRPVAMLAHMDVVDALPSYWSTDPYKPVEKDGWLYGRGTHDNKFGVAVLVSTFARLKKAGYVPDRDLLLAFSGDEETGMFSTRQVIANPLVAKAEFALNSDAGGGTITADGKPIDFGMQAAEKTNATFELTATNKGGHSSMPRDDNAIYDLADALVKLRSLKFPVIFNPITRIMTEKAAAGSSGELAAALRTLLENPSDAAAIQVARAHPEVGTVLWTTCVSTMLKAGNAPNALAQAATATVNCRILPGTPVADVQKTLAETVGNPAITIKLVGEAVESPASPLRADVTAMLQRAVDVSWPGAKLSPNMSSGGTEGREYRRAGIPTYGAGSLAMQPGEIRAHGTDERIPLASFYKELDYWDVLIRQLGAPAKR